MAVMKILHLLLELHVLVNSFLFPSKTNHDFPTFNRNNFPPNFIFGTASSSYQYEGAYNEDGRGLSLWDTYTHQYPEKIRDGGNGDVAVDHYHRYKEDVQLMKEMGMDAYRFSISWSRLLPNEKLSGGVNMKGIQFYNDLINEILSQGLQPYVTLFHWDIPQGLENEYGGFLSSRVVADFQDYAELCYKEFGDRVKHWITLNEPFSFSYHGYCEGNYALNRCSNIVRNCTNGNSATEPYIVSHNQLLAHAAAVRVYKQKYQVEQKGKIGITLVSYWMKASSQTKNDKDAARRALDFMFGWYMDPLIYGDYPKSMRSLVRDRLPQFSACESNMLKGSYDFIGINYYTSRYVADVPFDNDTPPTYTTDSLTNITKEKNGIPIGPSVYVRIIIV